MRLACRAQQVERVGISSSRAGLPPRLVRGRRAADVQRLVPLLFSVCRQAQGAAASAALAAAQGDIVEGAEAVRQEQSVALEMLQETIWRLLIDWPKAMDEPARVAPVARIRQLADRVTHDSATLDALLAAVDEVVAEHIYGMSSEQWLTIELDALDRWIANGATPAARLLRRLSDESPRLGESTVALMPEATLANLQLALLDALAAESAFGRAPHWNGRPAETGALARQASVPLMAALIARDGQTATTRFVARLVELADLIIELRRRSVRRLAALRAHALSDGVGIGLAETARGLLLHRARVEAGCVTDYCIVAPTEWNFHPAGPLPQGLIGRSAEDRGRLTREARTVVQSLDPCVACRVEIADA